MPIPVAPESKIVFRRDEIVTIAKGMARDPSTDDTTSRFPVVRYRDWLKEAYIYHLSILPLQLMRQMRQKAAFTVPPNIDFITEFFSPYFTECGTDPEYQCSVIAGMPHFCLRVVTISLDARICEFCKSEEEFLKGEDTAYFKATQGSPRIFISGNWFHLRPTVSFQRGGVLIYIARPFFYSDETMTDENYVIGLDAEATLLVAKYVACRKFEVDGEGQAYQMLHGEYTEELKNLMQMYGSQREDK